MPHNKIHQGIKTASTTITSQQLVTEMFLMTAKLLMLPESQKHLILHHISINI